MERKLNWMRGSLVSESRGTERGTRFGLPWGKGSYRGGQLYLKDQSGRSLPLQTEPQAYWPDGSVKWSLHSTVYTDKPEYVIITDEAPEQAAQHALLVITKEDNKITINTGAAVWTMETGMTPIHTTFNGNTAAGSLILQLENQLQTGGTDTLVRIMPCYGDVENVSLEREGDLQAVVRLHGAHVLLNGPRPRRWAPFDLRLSFYAGSAEVKMVHTLTFDGREEEDFIKGYGLEWKLPLRGALQNRFVRFGGETGLFCESPRSIWKNSRKTAHPSEREQMYRKQLKGEITPETQEILTGDMTVWSDYQLLQHYSDHYEIRKRTQAGCVWVKGAAGRRSLGVAYAGGENGGVGLVRRNFWQKAPSMLEVCGMNTPEATARVWFYSPEAPAIDMRRYDDKTHVEDCYEGFNEMRASGYGISNTNEAVIETFSAYPGNEALVEWAHEGQEPDLLLISPEEVVASKAFGDSWSPVNRTTPEASKIEDLLEDLFTQHKRIREQFDMYGFWDYGDIRHTYDYARHNWLYDMGGYAWQNTELVPNLWLWFSFLRSGRADYFEWAEAMTRHTSECDLYHLGPYKMLGSRHNVVHWGCGCKECRVGLTQMYKPYYYLTGDERTGEILEMEKDVDYAVASLDPLRAYYSPGETYSAHVRFGPDMMVFVGNWLTHWERTQDTVYRDKILKLLEHFRGEEGFAASSIWGYTAQTGKMELFEKDRPTAFNYCFGAEYVWPEVLNVLDDPDLWDAFMKAGLVYENKEQMFTYSNGVVAYVAGKTGNAALAAKCWADLLRDEEHSQHDAVAVPIIIRHIEDAGVQKPIDEAGFLSGNGTGQWGSHAIVMQAWITQYLTSESEKEGTKS